MIPLTMRERTRAVSAIVSPRCSWMSFELRNSACPPSWYMPTSNETRVRVEAFWKIIASDWPASASV